MAIRSAAMSARGTVGLVPASRWRWSRCSALRRGCGCGGGGKPAAEDEKAKDTEVLNVAIGQELSLIDVYRHAERAASTTPNGAPCSGSSLAQEQEHVDGWTKAMRGLGGKVEAEAEELDYSDLKSERRLPASSPTN